MGGAGRILSLTVQKQNQLEMERGKITPTSESSMEPLFRIFAVDHARVSHVPTWAQEVKSEVITLPMRNKTQQTKRVSSSGQRTERHECEAKKNWFSCDTGGSNADRGSLTSLLILRSR